MTETQTIHLLDLFDDAVVDQPRADYVGLQNLGVERDVRPSLFQHPDSSVQFPAVLLGREARLCFGCGIKSSVHDRIAVSVIFEIAVAAFPVIAEEPKMSSAD